MQINQGYNPSEYRLNVHQPAYGTPDDARFDIDNLFNKFKGSLPNGARIEEEDGRRFISFDVINKNGPQTFRLGQDPHYGYLYAQNAGKNTQNAFLIAHHLDASGNFTSSEQAALNYLNDPAQFMGKVSANKETSLYLGGLSEAKRASLASHIHIEGDYASQRIALLNQWKHDNAYAESRTEYNRIGAGRYSYEGVQTKDSTHTAWDVVSQLKARLGVYKGADEQYYTAGMKNVFKRINIHGRQENHTMTYGVNVEDGKLAPDIPNIQHAFRFDGAAQGEWSQVVLGRYDLNMPSGEGADLVARHRTVKNATYNIKLERNPQDDGWVMPSWWTNNPTSFNRIGKRSEGLTGNIQYGGSIRDFERSADQEISNYDELFIYGGNVNEETGMLRVNAGLSSWNSVSKEHGKKPFDRPVNPGAMPLGVLPASMKSVMSPGRRVDVHSELPSTSDMMGWALGVMNVEGRFDPTGVQSDVRKAYDYLNAQSNNPLDQTQTDNLFEAFSQGRVLEALVPAVHRAALGRVIGDRDAGIAGRLVFQSETRVMNRLDYDLGKDVLVARPKGYKDGQMAWNFWEADNYEKTSLYEMDNDQTGLEPYQVRVKANNISFYGIAPRSAKAFNTSSETVISAEQMNTTQFGNPSAGRAFTNMSRLGLFNNAATMMEIAALANVDEEAKPGSGEQRIVNTGGRVVNLLQGTRVRDAITKLNENKDLADAPIEDKASFLMKQLGGRNDYLMYDDGTNRMYFAPGQAMASTLVRNKNTDELVRHSGEVPNPAADMFDLLNHIGNAQSDTNSQLSEEQIDKLRNDAIRAHNSLLAYTERDEVQKKASGMTVKTLGGGAQTWDGMKANEVIVSQEAMSEATGILPSVLDQLNTKKGIDGARLGMTVWRDPAMNPARYGVNANVRFREKMESPGLPASEQMGRSIVVSETLQFLAQGDFDADRLKAAANFQAVQSHDDAMRAIALSLKERQNEGITVVDLGKNIKNIDVTDSQRRYIHEKDGRFYQVLVGANLKIDSENQMVKKLKRDVQSERQTRMEKFHERFGVHGGAAFFLEAAGKGAIPLSRIDEDFESSLLSRSNVGITFNTFERDLTMLNSALLKEMTDARHTNINNRYKDAIGQIAKYAGQLSVDLKGNEATSFEEFRNIMNFLDYDALNKGTPYMWRPGKEGQQFNNIDEMARYVTGNFLTYGQQDNPDKDSSIANNNAIMARAIAMQMLPVAVAERLYATNTLDNRLDEFGEFIQSLDIGKANFDSKKLLSLMQTNDENGQLLGPTSIINAMVGENKAGFDLKEQARNASPFLQTPMAAIAARHSRVRTDGSSYVQSFRDKSTNWLSDIKARASQMVDAIRGSGNVTSILNSDLQIGGVGSYLNSLINRFGGNVAGDKRSRIARMAQEATELQYWPGDAGAVVTTPYGRRFANPNVPLPQDTQSASSWSHARMSDLNPRPGENRTAIEHRYMARTNFPESLQEKIEAELRTQGSQIQSYSSSNNNRATIGTAMHTEIQKIILGENNLSQQAEISVINQKLGAIGKADLAYGGAVLDIKTGGDNSNWDTLNPNSPSFNFNNYLNQLVGYHDEMRQINYNNSGEIKGAGIIPVQQMDNLDDALKMSWDALMGDSKKALYNLDNAPMNFDVNLNEKAYMGKTANWWNEQYSNYFDEEALNLNVDLSNSLTNWQAYKMVGRAWNQKYMGSDKGAAAYMPEALALDYFTKSLSPLAKKPRFMVARNAATTGWTTATEAAFAIIEGMKTAVGKVVAGSPAALANSRNTSAPPAPAVQATANGGGSAPPAPAVQAAANGGGGAPPSPPAPTLPPPIPDDPNQNGAGASGAGSQMPPTPSSSAAPPLAPATAIQPPTFPIPIRAGMTRNHLSKASRAAAILGTTVDDNELNQLGLNDQSLAGKYLGSGDVLGAIDRNWDSMNRAQKQRALQVVNALDTARDLDFRVRQRAGMSDSRATKIGQVLEIGGDLGAGQFDSQDKEEPATSIYAKATLDGMTSGSRAGRPREISVEQADKAIGGLNATLTSNMQILEKWKGKLDDINSVQAEHVREIEKVYKAYSAATTGLQDYIRNRDAGVTSAGVRRWDEKYGGNVDKARADLKTLESISDTMGKAMQYAQERRGIMDQDETGGSSEELRKMAWNNALFGSSRGDRRRFQEEKDRKARGDESLLDLGFMGITDPNALTAIGFAGRVYNRITSPNFIWGAGAIMGQTVNRVAGAANAYQEDVAASQFMLLQTGGLNYDDAMSGQYGTILRRQATMQNSYYNFGKQSYGAWGWAIDALGGVNAGSGVLGAVGAIGLPGVGVAATAALAGLSAPVAIGAGLATAGIATAGYIFGDNSSDWYNIGAAKTQPNIITNLAGLAGSAGAGIRTIATVIANGGWTPETVDDWEKQQGASVFTQTIQNIMTGWQTMEEGLQTGVQLTLPGQTWHRELGSIFGRAELMGGVYNQYIQQMANRGFGPDAARSIFQSWSDFHAPTDMPIISDIDNMAQSASYGIADNIGSITTSLARLNNINPHDRAQLADIYDRTQSLLLSQENPVTAATRRAWSLSMAETSVEHRFAAGRDPMSEMNFDPLYNNPNAAALYANADQWISEQVRQSPYYTDTSPLNYVVQMFSSQGDAYNLNRMMGVTNISGQLVDSVMARRFGNAIDISAGRSTVNAIQHTFLGRLGYASPEIQMAGQQLISMMPNIETAFNENGQILDGNMAQQIVNVGDNTRLLGGYGVNPMTSVMNIFSETGVIPTQEGIVQNAQPIIQRLVGTITPQSAAAWARQDAASDIRAQINSVFRYYGIQSFAPDNDDRNTRVINDENYRNNLLAHANFLGQGSLIGGEISTASADFSMDMYAAIETGAVPAEANRQFSQAQFSMSALQRNRMFSNGFSEFNMSRFINEMGTLQPVQFGIAQGVMSGNPYMISQYATAMGMPELATINMQTGMNLYYENIPTSAISFMRANDDMNLLAGVTDMQLAGGMRGMAREAELASRGGARASYAYGTLGRRIDRALMLGGGTLQADGTVSMGDVGNTVGPLVSRLGMSFNGGNGMGYWQLEDANIALSREKQDWSMMRAGQNLGINQSLFDLEGRQFYENWNLSRSRLNAGARQFEESYDLNQRQFAWSTAYQQREMGIQYTQQMTQMDWQQEDLSFNRSMSEVQFGFQMRNFNRDIRYMRGRDRLNAMQQRDDSTVLHTMQMGQQTRQEERASTQRNWAEDQFKREKENFEKTTAFRQEEMKMSKKHHEENLKFSREEQDLSKKYFEERRALESQRMLMASQDHAKEIEWMMESRVLEDQKRLLDRQHYLIQQDLQQKVAAATMGAQEKVWKLQDAMQYLQERTERANASISLMTNTMSGQFLEAVQKLIDAMKNANVGGGTGKKPGGMIGGTPAMIEMGFGSNRPMAAGGYTGDGAKYESAGIFELHRGEYVVPQDGALVLRGDGGNEAMLRELQSIRKELEAIRAMGPGRVYATINNNGKQVATEDLLAQAYSQKH